MQTLARPLSTGRPGRTVAEVELAQEVRCAECTHLAAAGHVVVMRADGTTFPHEHAEVADASGRPVFALPGQTFGPELDVHAEFPTAGTYQLWAQFRLADGRVITVPFTVHAD